MNFAEAPELPEFRSSLRQLSQRLSSLRSAAEGVTEKLGSGGDGGSGSPVGSAAYMDMKVVYVFGTHSYQGMRCRQAVRTLPPCPPRMA